MNGFETEDSGIYLSRDQRVERLAHVLLSRVERDRPADPVEPQEIVVGSRGMANWLRHFIATNSEGQVCANVDFPFIDRALQLRTQELLDGQIFAEDGAAVDPFDSEMDPWSQDNLAWSVLRILEEERDNPSFEKLTAWTQRDSSAAPKGRSTTGRRGWSIALEIAGVIDQLIRHRPEFMVADEPHASFDSAPWLWPMWQTLNARIAAPHFARRLFELENLSAGGPLSSRPTLRVFGVSGLPPTTLRLLRSLARFGRVEIYAFVPSAAWLGEFKTPREQNHLRRKFVDRDQDVVWQELRAEFETFNPMLTTLGRLSRDFQVLLEELCQGYQEREGETSSGDVPETTLAQLQHDIEEAVPWPHQDGSRWEMRRDGDAPDRSIQIHSCFGALRQVEAARDVLLEIFESRPDIQPRHVLLMTPDLATYAPLVRSVFEQGYDEWRAPEGAASSDSGGWGPTGAPRIPVTIADLGVRSVNSVADALMRILELAEGRVTAPAVVELLALGPVRARFGLSADDLDLVRNWVNKSGMRWGRDEADRARHNYPDSAQTLLYGMKRLALGVVQADDPHQWESGPVPFDDIEGGEVVALGRLLHFLRTLECELDQIGSARTATGWADALRNLLARMTQTERNKAFLSATVVDALRDMSDAASTAGFEGELDLAAIRRWLDGRFEYPVRGDRRIDGAASLSSLRPLRSVPHKVVILLGMEDATFPRGRKGLGFNPMHRAPRLGDRDARDEDRHLFLEAILSARDYFIVTFTGHHERTGESMPPAVPVADLLDALDAGWTTRDDKKPSEAVFVEHALQPFSAAALAACEGKPPTWGRVMIDVACALADPARVSPLWFGPDEKLASIKTSAAREVTLADLKACVINPSKFLLRKRLGVSLDRWDRLLDDRGLVELQFLEKWQLMDNLLSHALESELEVEDLPARLEERMRSSAVLPPGGLGKHAFSEAWKQVQIPLTESIDARKDGLGRRHIHLQIGDRLLVGQVEGVRSDGRLVRVIHDDPESGARHQIAAWIDALVLDAAAQTSEIRDRGPIAEIYGVNAKKMMPSTIRLHAPADARAELANLLEWMDEATSAPVPVAAKTTFAWARYVESLGEAKALQKADAAWRSRAGRTGEVEKPFHKAIFEHYGPHRVDQFGDQFDPAFNAHAMRIWEPIMSAYTLRKSPALVAENTAPDAEPKP